MAREGKLPHARVAQFRGLPRTLSMHYTYNFF
jgi:hypothetical protein